VSRWRPIVLVLAWLAGQICLADDVIYTYEGDVLPYDESAGWEVFNPCEPPCTESLEGGHFVLRWPEAEDLAHYSYLIAGVSDVPPATLWVEWNLRSNHARGPYFYSCDAGFTVHYDEVHEKVYIYGDAAFAMNGYSGVSGLELNAFHTYRFESLDGRNYTISVDGAVFVAHWDFGGNGVHYLQFGGLGGCDETPNIVNAWDFIRFGTISYGEQITASDPPDGFVNARRHAMLDRFTVTFGEPNYVYVDEITVDVTGGDAPEVIQTRRLDNGPPDTVEIVLDRPIPMGETTTFTFDDGVAVNVIEYTFAPGDTNGNGLVELDDIAEFQRCFGQSPPSGPCLALDLTRDGSIDLDDHAALEELFSGP